MSCIGGYDKGRRTDGTPTMFEIEVVLTRDLYKCIVDKLPEGTCTCKQVEFLEPTNNSSVKMEYNSLCPKTSG